MVRRRRTHSLGGQHVDKARPGEFSTKSSELESLRSLQLPEVDSVQTRKVFYSHSLECCNSCAKPGFMFTLLAVPTQHETRYSPEGCNSMTSIPHPSNFLAWNLFCEVSMSKWSESGNWWNPWGAGWWVISFDIIDFLHVASFLRGLIKYEQQPLKYPPANKAYCCYKSRVTQAFSVTLQAHLQFTSNIIHYPFWNVTLCALSATVRGPPRAGTNGMPKTLVDARRLW